MPIKAKRKLFVIIQPLQYLQALELLEEDEERILIVPWANEKNQLRKLVNEDDWDKVIWIEYSGTALDIIKNKNSIKVLLNKLGTFDEVILSAYYNEFMNLVANSNPNSNIMLLEDGNATLTIDSSKHYKTIKFWIKYFVCKLYSFDISPINKVTLFILKRQTTIKNPRIAAKVRINDFAKLRAEVENYENDNSVYFISSAFINASMISKVTYIDFLIKLAKMYSTNAFKIILHRFDKKSDFVDLETLEHVQIIESSGPVELYFKAHRVRPLKIISAGSAATETLNLIYGIDVEIIMPMIANFNSTHHVNLKLMVEHLKKTYNVEFL